MKRIDNRTAVEMSETSAEWSRREAQLHSTAERLQLAQIAAQVASRDSNLANGTVMWTGSELAYGLAVSEVDTVEKCLPHAHPDDLATLRKALEPVTEGAGEYEAESRVIWPDASADWLVGRGKGLSRARMAGLQQ